MIRVDHSEHRRRCTSAVHCAGNAIHVWTSSRDIALRISSRYPWPFLTLRARKFIACWFVHVGRSVDRSVVAGSVCALFTLAHLSCISVTVSRSIGQSIGRSVVQSQCTAWRSSVLALLYTACFNAACVLAQSPVVTSLPAPMPISLSCPFLLAHNHLLTFANHFLLAWSLGLG